MKTLGNILWFLLIGIESAIAYFLLGIICCITIIGIPFGKQCFKIGRLALWPIGKTIKTNFSSHPIANVIWLLIAGIALAVSYVISGAVLCITIIGIPFGKQCFKLASLSLIPFGAKFD